MARNNSPARRAERAEAAASRQSAAPALVDEQPVTTLSDRVIRRLCWRARGWAGRASWR